MRGQKNIQRGASRGFTLIELMIVVAIVGILASIALPAYKDYTIRARLTEAVTFASACKTSVFEYFTASTLWPADVTEAGCANINTPKVVSAVTVADGVVTVSVYGTRTGIGQACALILTPDATGRKWTGTTTFPTKYVPSNFR
jgi:type IV pilus assembly protein PilA